LLAYWRPQTIIAPPLETRVIVESPGLAPFAVPLEPAMAIGQARDNDLVLSRDPAVARRHARLWRSPDGLEIHDLGSAGGTSVFGRRVDRRLLHVGDVLLVGQTWLSFEHTTPDGPALPEEAARLLSSVCEAPDDDAPRLVLADWLAARGDPRGEFIACQIAAETGVNPQAGERAEALLAAHELAWAAPLPAPVASWTFRRGFLDCVWIHPGRDVSALRARHPIRAVVEIESARDRTAAPDQPAQP
jgi:uncharacterized protein (TIGR02996 family)